MRRNKVLNITLTIVLSIAFILLGIFVFYKSYLRLFETLVDLWNSIKIYFLEIFGISHSETPTVEGFSKVMNWELILAEDWQGFKDQTQQYFELFASEENFNQYLSFLGEKCSILAKILAISAPCIIVLMLLIKRIYQTNNTDHNKDTKFLVGFKWLTEHTYQPIKRYLTQYFEFLKDHKYIPILWAITWVLHLNLGSVLVAFFAYYFYFAVSYKFETMYVQFYKLILDLQVLINALTWWGIAIILWCLFCRFRKKIAMSKLRRFEARNCGFINELPIVSMTCGSMGKKKTTIITDMALSQEVMFRQKAFELLQKNDMKFPYFPWISFEQDMINCIKFGTIFNLASVKDWVEKKRARFAKNGDPQKRLYGYDIDRYGTTYNDALRVWNLFDVLSSYAQLYFIYIITSSLMVSNYSVRSDNMLLSEGNFPMWVTDFFPDETIEEGRHAHILDFDVLRLGKKLIDNNPNAGSFEFGVVLISEVGKERGNNLELKEVKKNNDEANQKNDLFNSWLKMCRHSATVDNFPFIKVFTDEQRPESWGADARELCDIIHIVGSGKQRLALPFYTIEEMLTEWTFNRFIDLYYDLRFRRGDNTLLVYILKGITAWLFKRNAKIHNRFGYSISNIEKERGTMDGKIEKKKYYLMNKKIYARRFSTDCFSDYFNDLAKKTKIGLNDYLEYATEKATVDELKEQNSYFINALYKNAGPNP